jgi:Kelch motif
MSRGRLLAAAATGVAVVAAGVVAVLPGSADAGWERAASLSQRRSYIAAAELGGFVYAAGGMVGETGRPLASFTRYDPEADRWDVLRQMPVPTRAAAAAALGGRIYVTGGTTADGNTAATWAYDPETGVWSGRAPLPRAMFNHAAATVGSRLFVLGGFADGRELRDVYAYDPGRDGWERITRMPLAGHAFGAVEFRDELWVLGGRRGEDVLREVWILDPESLRWRRGPAMPRGMELLGADTHGDEIHAVWESVYQVYDAGTGRWRDGPRPLVTRHALEAFVLDGSLYTVGGCTTALRDSPIVERLRLGG